MATTATLCYVIKQGKILLIKKKTGVGAGKWNGPGGKVNENESIADAASREMFEEINVVPDNPKFMGVTEFYKQGVLDWIVHVFISDDYDGIEKETQEAAPRWFPLSRIPYDEMWPDDRIWMPVMLQRKLFNAKFYYDDKEQIISHSIETIE